MPDGSGVMFMLKTSFFDNASANLPPPAKSNPGNACPRSSVGVWQPTQSASVTRYLPRSAGVDAGCDGCGVVMGLGIVLTRYSSGPGRLRFGTVFFTAGI